MASSSPGHVKITEGAEDVIEDTPDGTRAPAQAAVSPVRTSVKKRARGSPSTPARQGALAVLGSLTDTVRATAVRGLRAFTDSIERSRDDASSSGSSDAGPPSPTDGVRAVTATPDGKRRRTTLTDALTRRSHADWRGARWDYSSAMRDNNLARVGDTGPSVFAFPSSRPHEGDGLGGTEQAPTGDHTDPGTPRPQSAMSAASAPAVLSTPRTHTQRDDDGDLDTEGSDHRGWIVSVAQALPDPFALPAAGPDDPMLTDPTGGADGNEDEERESRFISAVRNATALMSRDTVNSPDACGALLAFQARLRSFDPYGNFTSPAPAGDSVADELRHLRRVVDEVAMAQRASAEAIRALANRPAAVPPARPNGPDGTGGGGSTTGTASGSVGASSSAATAPGGGNTPSSPPATARVHSRRPATATPALTTSLAPQPAATPSDATPRRRTPVPAKAIGRHDDRRAVFRPAVPFGGRIPAPATPEDVRRLNLSAYLVRDDVNAALRDATVERMDETTDPVQVTAVNWTARGNLCVITCEAFTAAELLLQAVVVAGAANLGAGWKASRDVPVFKAVLNGVPTKRADGRLLTEDEILGDLRAHSATFNTLTLADATEPASWVSRDDERARRDHSTLALNLATAADAERLLTMRHCLFAFGRACEPGAFQPRARERICQRCWNPLARHTERDFVCVVRCRLCGERHAEEDHTCHECDVLARSCVHIPLRCVNCTRPHAADDGACEYRRRMRGTNQSAPPMSSSGGTQPPAGAALSTVGRKRKKGKRVRVLDPHEPFPEDTAPALTLTPEPVSSPSPQPTPPPQTPPPAQAAAGPDKVAPSAAPPRKRSSSRRKAAGRTPAAAAPPSPAQDRPPAGGDAPTTPDSPWAGPERGGAAEPALDDADAIALQDLVGDTADGDRLASEPVPAPSTGLSVPAQAGGRRASLPRAAAEADREARRRRAAHVLRREFSFLKLADAIAALRTCSDDFASAVSWAVEEQAARRKPGMQGKSAATLQRVVADMTAAAAKDTPRPGTDETPVPVDA